MDGKIRLSVIIPALNEERFLPLLLQSLSDQTCKNFEVIVVDGGSQDKTIKVAEKFIGKLPCLTILSTHKGLSHQRNFGAKHARSSWFVFSDADNVFLPYAIDRIYGYAKRKKPSLFTAWSRSDSEVTADALITLFSNMVIEGFMAAKKQFAPGPLMVIQKHTFEHVGGYNEQISWGEDYEISKRLQEAGYRMDILRETLYVWSLRRMRNEGNLTVLRKFALAGAYNLLTNKAFTRMPGYEMGGHLYGTKEKRSFKAEVSKLQKRFVASAREIFG